MISKLRHPWTASSASLSFQLDKAVYIFGSLKVNMDQVQRNTHKDIAHMVTDDHTTGVYVPYSLKRAVHVPWRPTRIKTVKERWDRTYGFFGFICLTIYTWQEKASIFSSVSLRSWVLVLPGFESVTSRSTDRRLSNWANGTSG